MALDTVLLVNLHARAQLAGMLKKINQTHYFGAMFA
jgi:hypothetical protein